MKLQVYCSLIFCLLFLFSCKDKQTDNTGLAARVGDHRLTLEEVERNVPPSLHGTDSAKVARSFVDSWVEEQAVTLMAEKTIPNTEEIEKMVEDYRRQLIMWEYRRLMTLQNGSQTHDDDDLNRYYDEHKESLKLERPIVKGLYIKIASNARELPEIKRLYRSEKIADMDKLEKLVSKAVNYEYFRDKWVDWELLESRIPSKELDIDPDSYPATHNHLEVTEDGYTYLLSINEHKGAGSIMPFEYARTRIIEALERENAVNYDKNLRRQLLERALEDGTAQIFVE